MGDAEGASHLADDADGERSRMMVQQFLTCGYLTSSILIWMDNAILDNNCQDALSLVVNFAREHIITQCQTESERRSLPRLLLLMVNETDVDKQRYKQYKAATFKEALPSI